MLRVRVVICISIVEWAEIFLRDMVGKKNSYIKCKSIGQSILVGKIYWLAQTKHHLQPWDPLESNHLQT